MNPLTKFRVEEIIDGLADKTLSFGCEVKINENVKHPFKKTFGSKWLISAIQGDNLCSLVSTTGDKFGTWISEVNLKILGHQIFIGNVLEKMNQKFADKQDWKSCDEAISNRPKLCELWSINGFTKSLQEIVEESGWEVRCENPALTEPYETLKSHEARALFEFIDSLNLIK